MDEERLKRKLTSPKTVPWEPYRGATSSHTKGCAPVTLPPLIPYRISSASKSSSSKSVTSSPSCSFPTPEAVDFKPVENGAFEETNGIGNGVGFDSSEAENEVALGKSKSGSEKNHCTLAANGSEDSELIQRLRQELEAERQLTAELKRMLVASMGDDLTCHIQALSEDKVLLASKVNTYAAQSSVDHNRAEDLEIMSDIWRCKFLAMSVRADELVAQRARLLTHLRKERQVLEDFVSAVQAFPPGSIPAKVFSEAQAVLSVDAAKLCDRTPCDEKVCRPVPNTSNLTIACCKNCASHEIKLL